MSGPASGGEQPVRIVTVCLGNICRSPTAQAAIVEAADHAGVAVDVRSAGTGTWHLGHPPDPRMTAAAADDGLTLSGVAERVDAGHLDVDLLLAMDRSNLADVERLVAAHDADVPVRLFRAFDDASVAAGDLEVPDPYYGGDDGFAHVVALCRAAAAGVVAWAAGERPDPGPH